MWLEFRRVLFRSLSRIIFPLIFWSIFYILFSLSDSFLKGDKITFNETIKYVYFSFMNGSSFHLWYIYMIIGIYLFIPIIGGWIRNCTEKEILYFLLIWFCTLFLNQPFISKLKLNIDLTYFSGYLGYLILGYYLSIKPFKNIIMTKTISIVLIVSGIIITALGTFIASYYKHHYSAVFYGYLTPHVMIASTGLFVLFKNQNFTNNIINHIIKFIGKYSYGIYLVHILVLSALSKFDLKWDFINPLFAVPAITFSCLFISSIIIYCVNRLPFGKYISG